MMPSNVLFLPGALGRTWFWPQLLLCGDADPISPVAVGQQLARHLPHASLQVFNGADHDLAYTHAAAVAALIDQHFNAPPRHGPLAAR